MGTPTSESKILDQVRSAEKNSISSEIIASEVRRLVEAGLVWRGDEQVVALGCERSVNELPSLTQPPILREL